MVASVNQYLSPSASVESDHPVIQQHVRRLTSGVREPKAMARELFAFARDSVAYTPFAPFARISDYRASRVLERGRGFCVQKAVVLASLARAARIPARLAFVDIRNHQAPEPLVAFLGTNLFAFHAYVQLRLGDRWVSATPAFDRNMSERSGYPVVEFDGERDAVLPATDLAGRTLISYETRRGVYRDVPLEELLDTWRQVYGEQRVREWIERQSAA